MFFSSHTRDKTKQQLSLFYLGKVRFFLGDWGISVFFPKKVLALPYILIEKTPDPHL